MAIILDESGAQILDESFNDIYDEAGVPATGNLVPVWVPGDGTPLNLASLMTSAVAAVMMFPNTGTEHLLVTASGSGVTVTVGIGAEVLGQAVTGFTPVTLTAGDLYQFGPYHSVLDQPGGDLIQVTLSSVSGVQVALVQWAASR